MRTSFSKNFEKYAFIALFIIALLVSFLQFKISHLLKTNRYPFNAK